MRASVVIVVATVSAFPTVANPRDGAAPNVVPLTVRTPRAGFNRMVVSITLCHPGTDRCATIDDVMVDTGSTGLRLEHSAMPPDFHLPAFTRPDGKPLAECLHFVHDDAWGSLHRADLHLDGLVAADLPIQIIADDLGPGPTACPGSTAGPTSNGTLGIGPHAFDCPGDCLQDAVRPGVFVEEDGSWVPVVGAVPVASRLPNPAMAFPQHGNGVIFDLPAVPADGADAITGMLTFGIDTAASDRIRAARIMRLDARGLFTTRYGGRDYPGSYIDSGTETYILADDRLPRCVGMAWAFCVSPPRALTAVMVGPDGRAMTVPFTVGDYRSALERRAGAWDGFAEVAEASSDAFVWGAPFFLGRRVTLVFDGAVTDAAVGPFYALP